MPLLGRAGWCCGAQQLPPRPSSRPWLRQRPRLPRCHTRCKLAQPASQPAECTLRRVGGRNTAGFGQAAAAAGRAATAALPACRSHPPPSNLPRSTSLSPSSCWRSSESANEAGIASSSASSQPCVQSAQTAGTRSRHAAEAKGSRARARGATAMAVGAEGECSRPCSQSWRAPMECTSTAQVVQGVAGLRQPGCAPLRAGRHRSAAGQRICSQGTRREQPGAPLRECASMHGIRRQGNPNHLAV